MEPCIATTIYGRQCTRNGKIHFEGEYCQTHFDMKLRVDEDFRTRYRQYQENQQQQQQQQQEAAEIARQQEIAQAQAENEYRRQQYQERKIRRNQRIIANAHLFSPDEIIHQAKHLMTMWDIQMLPGIEVPSAYILIRYITSTNVGFPNLIRAIATMVRQGLGNHPIHARYAAVPIEEREPVVEAMRTAITQYGPMTIDQLRTLLPTGDQFRRIILNHFHALEQAQLQHDLVHNPVVFQRDPEGSINLRAFANDDQSVHRSSVQSTTQRAALALLERPLMENQDTLSEVIDALNNSNIRWFGTNMRERAITELTNDYFNTEAFSLRYGQVFDHVWAFIKPHEQKDDLLLRLAQEVCEGIGMCTNGKMARLINVLQGYDETLEFEAPKDIFYGRIALLRNIPMEERQAAAQALFAEFHIPTEEHTNWLTPLLEA